MKGTGGLESGGVIAAASEVRLISDHIGRLSIWILLLLTVIVLILLVGGRERRMVDGR